MKTNFIKKPNYSKDIYTEIDFDIDELNKIDRFKNMTKNDIFKLIIDDCLPEKEIFYENGIVYCGINNAMRNLLAILGRLNIDNNKWLIPYLTKFKIYYDDCSEDVLKGKKDEGDW